MENVKSYFIIRPAWEEIQYPGAGIVMCSCGDSLWTMSELREHWQLGHFDRVVNPGDEEYKDPSENEHTKKVLCPICHGKGTLKLRINEHLAAASVRVRAPGDHSWAKGWQEEAQHYNDEEIVEC